MALFELTGERLAARRPASFPQLGLRERQDLQRLLRDQIEVLNPPATGAQAASIEPDLLVIGEEFGQWEDSRRRIDLLALDRAGRLVVIELKRTDDGGHMELQALRYAAMVSAMDFEDVATAYGEHLRRHGGDAEEARSELAQFLDTTEDEAVISSEVGIILVSADFGRELTTTVLWLNQFEGVDIRCVRVVPYQFEDRLVLDIQQVVPLPEAADYQVRVRRKQQTETRVRGAGKDYSRYHTVVHDLELPAENKRHAVRVTVDALLKNGAPIEEIARVLPKRKLRRLDRTGLSREEVLAAAQAADPGFDGRRWHLAHPLEVDGATYLLSNQWGVGTEDTLKALCAAFPQAGVTIRPASRQDGDQ